MRARIVEQLPTAYDGTRRVTAPEANHVQTDTHLAEHNTRYVRVQFDEEMTGFQVDVVRLNARELVGEPGAKQQLSTVERSLRVPESVWQELIRHICMIDIWVGLGFSVSLSLQLGVHSRNPSRRNPNRPLL